MKPMEGAGSYTEPYKTPHGRDAEKNPHKLLGLTSQSWQDTVGVLSSVVRQLACYTEPDNAQLGRHQRDTECLNSDRPARTATRRCPQTRLKLESVLTSARSAQRASITCSRMFARTVAAGLFPDQSGRRRTGKVTTSLVRTLRVPRSNTGRLIRQFMRGFRPKSKPYHLTNDRARQ